MRVDEETKNLINTHPTSSLARRYDRCLLLERIITKGKLESLYFNFPEKSEWYFCQGLLTFYYFENAQTTQSTNLAIGHIQQSRDKSYLEIQQDCSCLYFVETPNIDTSYRKELKYNVSNLMKMIYVGIKSKKITQIPEKIGIYIFFSKVSESKILKDEIKESTDKYLTALINGTTSFQPKFAVKKEELYWAKNNLDSFMEKLDFKTFFWEDLIASIENDQTRAEINAFYEKCKNNDKQ